MNGSRKMLEILFLTAGRKKDGKKIFPKIFPKIFWMVFPGAFSHFAFLIPWVVGLMEFSDVTK